MKVEVSILGGQRIDLKRRKDGREARGNEEERIEKGSRERIEKESKSKRQKGGVEKTI